MQKRTSKNQKPSIGLSLLSWRSWNTLETTLKSHQEKGLFNHFDKIVIYFQDLCDQDIEIANRYGLDYTGGPNSGIAGGMRNGVNYLGTDYVLFLENDCPTIASPREVKHELALAIDYLMSGKIDVMRLRSRLYPGEGFADISNYLRYYLPRDPEPSVDITGFITPAWKRWLRWMFKPYNVHRMKGRSLYVEKHPELLFPSTIHKTEDGIWIGDSSCMDWTNQSVLTKRTLFSDVLMPYLDTHFLRLSKANKSRYDPERPLNCRWWRNHHFKIGQGPGIFTNNRFDGSWRSDHPAYEP
jgi:hypothetical protein